MPRMNLAARLAPLLLLGVAAAACAAPVGISRPGVDRVYSDLRANALNRGLPSGTSIVVLDRYDLGNLWEVRPTAALERLLDAAVTECDAADGRRDTLFALAELHLLAALDGWGRDHALAAAAFASEFLFAANPGRPPDPWDSLFADARDIHARALLEALRADSGSPEIRVVAGKRDLPRGSMEITVDAAAVTGPDGLPPLYAADEFAIRGLRVRQRRGGLGLPVVVRPPTVLDGGTLGLLYRGLPPYAGTVILRVEGGLPALAAGRVRGTLSVVPSGTVETVKIGERSIPVAADFTAPVALTLEFSRAWDFEFGGLFSGEPEFRPGLILTSPHRPGRIPVVFVHGTASSPARWAELVNTLHGEKWIRDRFEVWLFTYATGNPVSYSAGLLRKSLAEAVSTFDPEGKDPALRRMVLVGHSQGGLLCRMVTSSSGAFSSVVLQGKRLEDLDLHDEPLAMIRDSLEFAPSPSVARVVYICTPHTGSFLAAGWIGSITNSFVEVGSKVADIARRPFRTKTGEIAFPKGLPIPTSFENMMPGSNFLKAIAQMPPAPGVTFHTIVAVDGEGDPADLDDGVVAYKSAHRPGAASEFIIRWNHSCQSHPLVVEEVRRILIEHAGADAGAGAAR